MGVKRRRVVLVAVVGRNRAVERVVVWGGS